MNQSKSHPILAALFDFYFVSLNLLALLVLVQSLFGRVIINEVMLVSLFLFLLIADVIYYTWISKKNEFSKLWRGGCWKIFKKLQEGMGKSV